MRVSNWLREHFNSLTNRKANAMATTAPLAAVPAPVTKQSFFHRLVAAAENFFHKAPKVEVQIASTLNYTAPFIEAAIDMVDPAAGAVANPIIERIKTGFSALSVTTQDTGGLSGTVLQNANAIVASVQSNLSQLEGVAGIKDPASQQKFKGLLDLINGELTAVQGAFPTK